MSVEAISWVLNLAPVPAGAGSRPPRASSCSSAGQPRRAGRHGHVSLVASPVRCTGLSERTARTCLDRLAAEGIIWPYDPGIVAARIKRADRPPQGWDLNLNLVRHLDAPAVAVLDRQLPGLGGWLTAAGRPHVLRPDRGPAWADIEG